MEFLTSKDSLMRSVMFVGLTAGRSASLLPDSNEAGGEDGTRVDSSLPTCSRKLQHKMEEELRHHAGIHIWYHLEQQNTENFLSTWMFSSSSVTKVMDKTTHLRTSYFHNFLTFYTPNCCCHKHVDVSKYLLWNKNIIHTHFHSTDIRVADNNHLIIHEFGFFFVLKSWKIGPYLTTDVIYVKW